MSYVVGIDLGTTSTVAAVCRPGGAAQVVPLEGAAGAVPSAVYLGADGTFLVGEAAQRRELSDPGHVVRDLTRRVGDPTPLLVGRQPVSPDELVARFLVRVVDDVAKRESGVAARVAVTHPAGWGPHRLGALHAALAEQGLGSATLIPEPVAAATGYAASERVEPGATVGVYDLGGGRCGATVLRRGPDGFTVVGSPDGVERFGGADLDEVVLAHVREALGPAWEELDPTDPEVLAAAADLRRAATAAKEALSHDTEVLIPVVLPGVRTQVRLGRAEFEEMIRPALVETAESVRRALDGAGMSAADLAALVLVGGSSRIPLVPQLLSEEFGRDVTVAPDPVGVVAMGAALLAGGAGGARTRAPKPAAVGAPARIPPAKVALAGAALGAGVGSPAGTTVGAGTGSAPERPPARGGVGVAGGTGASRPASQPDPSAERSGPGTLRSGPGTLPLAVGRSAGPPDGTDVLAVARPPKQARPFQVADPATSRTRRVVLVASAGALALAVLGGVVAFGIGRIGATSEAGAVTPAAVDTSAPAPSLVIPVETPARKAPPPPPPTRRGNRAAATTSAAPPTATATSTPPKATEEPPTTAPPETTAPGDDGVAGGGGNSGNGDTGAGTGTGGSGSGTGGADNNAAGGDTGAGDGTTTANVAAGVEPDAPAEDGPQNG
ncbi:MAG TPA: Hsp70 family protein [Pseudonocardia sp.]|nr:Hsp70 family protein [Pseudonocardia sp.]